MSGQRASGTRPMRGGRPVRTSEQVQQAAERLLADAPGVAPGTPPLEPSAAARQTYPENMTYMANPFTKEGREAIENQFKQAPDFGIVQDFAMSQGASSVDARLIGRATAGLLAVGVGVPAFLAAVNQLNNQTPGTIPILTPVINGTY